MEAIPLLCFRPQSLRLGEWTEGWWGYTQDMDGAWTP